MKIVDIEYDYEEHEYGTNPCSEIILRPNQFCNLTEVIVRPDDTMDDLRRKVRLATILGTIQSSLTNFRGLRKVWRNNTEEERLLGVSLTGICDHGILNGASASENVNAFVEDGSNNKSGIEGVLAELRGEAIATNTTYAARIGIEASTSITCVKPSGTVSQLCASSSGIHPRYAPFYIRRVRADKSDPLCTFMESEGFTSEEDYYNSGALVYEFPIRSPEGSICTKEVSALQQLELWKTYALHWCEHKPSITVHVKDGEWVEVAAWVYENFDLMSGVAFLPYEDNSYVQAPYEEIDEETYNEMLKNVPDRVDWTKFREENDATTASQELACTAGGCDL